MKGFPAWTATWTTSKLPPGVQRHCFLCMKVKEERLGGSLRHDDTPQGKNKIKQKIKRAWQSPKPFYGSMNFFFFAYILLILGSAVILTLGKFVLSLHGKQQKAFYQIHDTLHAFKTLSLCKVRRWCEHILHVEKLRCRQIELLAQNPAANRWNIWKGGLEVVTLVPVTEQSCPQQRVFWQPLWKGYCTKCNCMSINFDLVIIAVFLIGQVLMKEKSEVLMLILSAPSAAFADTGYRLWIALTGWLLMHTVSVLGGTCLLPAENTEVAVMDIAELCFFTLLPCKAAELGCFRSTWICSSAFL